MIRFAAALGFLFALGGLLGAQEDKAELKKRLMEKVRERVRAEHKEILKRVAEAIDEEFAAAKEEKEEEKAEEREEEKAEEREEEKAEEREEEKAEEGGSPWTAKIKTLQKELKKLEIRRRELEWAVRRLQRFEEDTELAEKAKKDGPTEIEQAVELFDSALAQHEDGNFDVSIRDFKRIFYIYRNHQLGFTAAYNVACAYALDGKADLALDWLEISVEHGFRKWDHIRQDPDLKSLRDDIRYKRLMADK